MLFQKCHIRIYPHFEKKYQQVDSLNSENHKWIEEYPMSQIKGGTEIDARRVADT
ncbi:hypothetical protein F511_00541 [Dorcoceras hygrometricum]|uniref:Uncharacterized protein n=1 Tax=Dorcoceras hygrometricum TaxID=472368 RepID=A0A2Z7BCI8_9LAMI|nr:hypothetical protein F511_00541 [Dorcoceras hygrometricum]